MGGITTGEPHKTHTSKTLSSRRRLEYGMKSGPDNVQPT